MSDTQGKGLALLALLLAVTLWASSFIVLKVAFTRFDPMVVIFGRMAVASLCFLFFFRPLVRMVDYRPGDWRLLLFMGVCEPGLYFIFEAMALTYTDASQAGMICALLPLMVALGARFHLGEHTSRRTFGGFTLAIIGVVALSAAAAPSATAPNPVLGNSLEFLAMVCATGYMVTMKGLMPRYSPWFLTMIQAFVGSIFYFPLLFLPSTTMPTTLDPIGIGSIIFLGVFVTILAYGFYNFGMSKIPASQASAFVNLIPVITLVFAWFLLGERLTPLQYAASGVVLTGVFLSQDRKTAQPATT